MLIINIKYIKKGKKKKLKENKKEINNKNKSEKRKKIFENIKISQNLKGKIKFIIIMIALTIFASYPYLPEGTMFAHDLCYHLARIISTSNELSNGIFPVFIHSDLLGGLGYGNPLFYPELFLYIPIMFLKIGFGILFSYKAFLMIITFSTLLITFYSAKIISKDKKVAWLTTLLYTLSLYRFIDIYARGALGEILSFTFLPLIIAGIYDIIWGENKRWYLISFAIFGIMNSHILSFAMSVVLIILFCIVNCVKIFKDKKKILNVFLAGMVSILLISSYMFTYTEQKMNDILNVDVHKNSGESLKNNASGLQEAFWNELKNDDSYTTRSIGLLLLVLPVTLFMIKDKKEKKEFKFYLQVYIIGMFVWYMSLNLFPWERCGFLSIIQFPYRLNIISTFLLSFVAGYAVINAFENKEEIAKLLTIIILIVAAKQLSEVKINAHSLTYEALMSGPLIANGEYKPMKFSEDEKDVFNINEKEKKIPFTRKGSKITFDYKDEKNKLELHVPFTYYKGYRAYIVNDNGEKKELKVEKDNENAHLRVSGEEKLTGKIIVEYKMTVIQKCGYSISLITLILLISYVICSNNKMIEEEKSIDENTSEKVEAKV